MTIKKKKKKIQVCVVQLPHVDAQAWQKNCTTLISTFASRKSMHELLSVGPTGKMRTRKWEGPEETPGLRSAPLQQQLAVDKQPDGTR